MARKSRQQEQQRFLLPSAVEIKCTDSPIYHTGIYARLSRPNLKDTQVDVLASQLHHLQEYVSCHADMELIDTYVDDGWSGLNFKRPDFTRMMEDVKAGKINCIVVRDFSRFGRNYLETGYYLQEIFSAYEVRFISIFDEFDSLTSDTNSMIFSMMQIVNDFYSKDISRKICSVYDDKVSKGFCWGNIPNGYLRRKDGTGRLLMDEQIAPAIYLAYHWLKCGVKYAQVARNLNMLGLSHHSPSSNQEDGSNLPWTNFHILLLTENPLYTGDYAYNRSRNRKYDSSHQGPRPMEAWKYVPNTHPGYISKETYESDSITNQRELIYRYLAAHPEFSGWRIHEFVDDGYSGTSENRPEFQRMINLTRHGQIKCIIVKDFSRFARNYITMGDYLEQIFPFLGVRFISINDGYDSTVTTNITDNMSMVLKSILNSYYSRDLSAKMFSCNTQRMKNGSFTGSPCFGYKMNPERTHFVIDPESAEIVRFIFDLALDGKTRPEIVTVLNDRGFPTPAEYNRQHGHGKKDMVTAYPLWDHIKVSNILRQEAYTGKLIMRKRVKVAPCAKKHRPTEPSEQFVRENAHEPIVSQEEFDRVQAMIPKRKGWNRENQKQYPLKGLVRCGTCGKVMPLRDQRPDGVFQCQEALIDHSVCSRKLFPMPEVEQTAFQTLQPILRQIIQEEKKHSRKQKEKRLSQCKSSRSDLIREREQLQQKKTQCYEAYVSGVLTLEAYLEQKSVYTQKGQELDQQIESLDEQQTMLSFSSVPADLRQAADNAKTFSNAEELTREMAVCFIQRIYLYENHMEIQWKFKDLFTQFIPAAGEGEVK